MTPWTMRGIAALMLLTGTWTATATACPFCSAVSQSLCERINTSDLAVLVELVELSPRASDATASPTSTEAIEAAKSTFRILQVYRGEPDVKVGDLVKATYQGKAAPGSKALLTGLQPKAPEWTLPLELSPRALDYLQKLLQFPPRGTERLNFVEDYLEDAETLLQEDALNEYAMADYATIRQTRDTLDHDRLVHWIKDPATPETRRRLYFTLLGICGGQQDLPLLESMIRSGAALDKDASLVQLAKNRTAEAEKEVQLKEAKTLLTEANERLTKALDSIKTQQASNPQLRGLDALIACYLTLGKAERLPMIEELFLRKKDADYTQTYAAIMAIRFHGQQGDVIPRQRAIEALRLMLDRPALADLVLPDLSRWEDWDNIDKLVELFKASTKEMNYVRVPIINYLRVCPRPEAKAKLEELAKIDPESYKRALTFFPFTSADKKEPQAEGAAQKDPAAKQEPTAPAKAEPEKGAIQTQHSGKTVALAMGTTSSAAPAVEPAADAKGETADEAAAVEAATLGVLHTPVAPSISSRSLKILVGSVPVATALALFGILWAILRVPKQTYVDEVKP